MDHAADAFRTDLMTITRYLLKEQSRHLESRGDFTILLSHIVLGCKFVTLNKAGQAKLIGLSVQSNVQVEERKEVGRALPTRCWSMPLSAVAAPAFLCPRRTRRLHTWTESSVGSTVSALIPWMAPPTSTAACPSEWYAHK
ncbi:hypothetical protein CFC21_075539 [Triticum aestivum]|uniref:Fructose-1-6-bisphosphatase class I N-terminal domain-containing protein n=2 Tax=Triticum aestivum TaxID=4565 RepID=A0A9R1KXI6_WHEAT|nr:hypothetical protein CFC21_075539 [Triticum aestivum]